VCGGSGGGRHTRNDTRCIGDATFEGRPDIIRAFRARNIAGAVASFLVGTLPNNFVVNDSVSRVPVAVGLIVIRSAIPRAISTAEGRRGTRGRRGSFTQSGGRSHSRRGRGVVCWRRGGEETRNIGWGFGEASSKDGPSVLNTRHDAFRAWSNEVLSALLSLGTFPNVLVRVIHECPGVSLVVLRDISGVPPGD